MKRLLLAAAAGLVGGLTWIQPATACVGGSPPVSPDLVFTGTVVRRDDPATGPVISSIDDPFYWTFAVDNVEKGEADERFTVSSPRDGAACGIDFELGQRYRVMIADAAAETPGVTIGAAEDVPALVEPPPIEGEFSYPWRFVTWISPYEGILIGVLVLLIGLALSSRARRRRKAAI